jgi:hypothetical protein
MASIETALTKIKSAQNRFNLYLKTRSAKIAFDSANREFELEKLPKFVKA